MKKKFALAAVLVGTFASQAFAGNPNLSGSFKVTQVSNPVLDGEIGTTITLTPVGANELDLTSQDAKGVDAGSVSKLITDGSKHPLVDGTGAVLTSAYNGDALVITTTVGDTVFSAMTLSVDPSGQTLTYTLSMSGETATMTAVKVAAPKK